MPRETVEENLPANCEQVFDLIHDYDQRLEWDTLLSEAYLEPLFFRQEKAQFRFAVDG